MSDAAHFLAAPRVSPQRHLRLNCLQAAVRELVGAACPSGGPGSSVYHSRAHQRRGIAHLSRCALVLHRVRWLGSLISARTRRHGSTVA